MINICIKKIYLNLLVGIFIFLILLLIFKQNNINLEYLSVGNLHGVIIVDNLKTQNEEVEKLKDLIKQSKIQKHINIEIIQIVNKNKISMLVFERGVG